MLSAYEILFNVWIKSSEAKVLYTVVGNYLSVIYIRSFLVMESRVDEPAEIVNVRSKMRAVEA